MSLYPNHKIRGARKDWDSSSMDLVSTGNALRQHGVPNDWDDPIDAMAWATFDGEIKVIVADYSNGRRVEMRNMARSYRLTFSTPTDRTAVLKGEG